MPRKNTNIQTGKVSPKKASDLTGAGITSTPHIGETEASLTGLEAHVEDTQAHASSSIHHTAAEDSLLGGPLSSALSALIDSAQEPPPMLGQISVTHAFTGVPDWGTLKLGGNSLSDRSFLPLKNDSVSPADIFPYYLKENGAASSSSFSPKMADPESDHLFNSGTSLDGGGQGLCQMGAFTRGGAAGPAPLPLNKSYRLALRGTKNDASTGRPNRQRVVVSGSIFPADRGVLALLHIPPNNGGDLATEFLAQPLISDETDSLSAQGRVVAALLLGGGILTANTCDGSPGGIFAVGEGSSQEFPSRRGGQYDLKEIHLGVDDLNGDSLRPPFDDLDGDSVAGSARESDAIIPAPGQVRLGTDPSSAVDSILNGIPILGGTSDAFVTKPTTQNGSLGDVVQGDALVVSSNFFGFRLPVLKDYSQDGLRFTPRGEDSSVTQETGRFFDLPTSTASTYADGSSVGATLKSAGGYEGFDEDFPAWQIARFRQSFLLPSQQVAGEREDVGSYWLVHFKSERDFEKCVRDGVFPWDLTDPYEIFGASLVDTTSFEGEGNVANLWVGSPLAPNGPAPAYGKTSEAYHPLRSSVFLDPEGDVFAGTSSASWDWSTVVDATMMVSGVGYFTPLETGSGSVAFNLTELEFEASAGFWGSFGTDDDDLTAGADPAKASSSNPVFVGHAPFAYGDQPGKDSSLNMTLNVDPASGHIPSLDYQRRHRFELPYTFLGSNGSGAFDEANSPLESDTATYDAQVSGGDIVLIGDTDEPSFSSDASLRAFFRRPLGHGDPETTVLPFSSSDGHGVKLTPDTAGQILFHSTRFSKIKQEGSYGNFVVDALGSAPNTSYSALSTPQKDVEERFLDETYRLLFTPPAALNGTGPYTAATIAHIQGPGLQGWMAPIEIPVRSSQATAPFNSYSWLLTETHIEDLSSVGTETENALQVGGLPDRNPPITAATTSPFPSAGLLKFPQIDYSSGYVPASASALYAPNQPDYSGIGSGVRTYLRCFDVGFSKGTYKDAVSMVGEREVTLRLDGITLDDIAYDPSGTPIQVSVKVPGLTTWMDLGRKEGEGPNKQDASQDGAGCQLSSGSYTFTDPETGYKGCYVKVDVGSAASFFENPATYSGYSTGSPQGEVPLLTRVQMDNTASDYALEKAYSGGVFGAVTVGADPRDLRGLFGISIVHPNDTLILGD